MISRGPTPAGLYFFIGSNSNTLSIVHWHRGSTGDKKKTARTCQHRWQMQNCPGLKCFAGHILPSPGLVWEKSSYFSLSTLKQSFNYLVRAVWSQRSLWEYLLSECRGKEHGAVMKAPDSFPGMPSSVRCLQHESIATNEHT